MLTFRYIFDGGLWCTSVWYMWCNVPVRLSQLCIPHLDVLEIELPHLDVVRTILSIVNWIMNCIAKRNDKNTQSKYSTFMYIYVVTSPPFLHWVEYNNSAIDTSSNIQQINRTNKSCWLNLLWTKYQYNGSGVTAIECLQHFGCVARNRCDNVEFKMGNLQSCQ